MKAKNRIVLAVAAATIAGLVVYSLQRRKKNSQLAQIADEGYETAHDVLFPHNKQRRKKYNYGQEYTL